MTMLSPVPKFAVTFVNADGETRPGVGYQLFTYLAGTSTPKTTYQDFAKIGSNTNPVVMDARGECDLWLDGSYKFVLKTDTGTGSTTVWTVDEIRDQTTDQTFTNVILAGTLSIGATSVTWSGNPTHSGNHTFTGNVTVNGNTVIGNASTDTLTIAPNAVTWSNNPTHSGDHTFSGSLAIANGGITPNTYTPTATAGANVTTATGVSGRYVRIGNMVIVSGTVTIDPTLASTASECGISLPIASNLGGSNLTGFASIGQGTTIGQVVAVIGDDSVNDRASMNWVSGSDVASRNWAFWFHYQIV